MILNRKIDVAGDNTDQDLSRAVDKAIAYEALEHSEGFKFLMERITEWADTALAELREADAEDDDRAVRLRQLRWKEREALIQEIHHELLESKQYGTEAASQLQVYKLTHLAPMTFGESE